MKKIETIASTSSGTISHDCTSGATVWARSLQKKIQYSISDFVQIIIIHHTNVRNVQKIQIDIQLTGILLLLVHLLRAMKQSLLMDSMKNWWARPWLQATERKYEIFEYILPFMSVSVTVVNNNVFTYHFWNNLAKSKYSPSICSREFSAVKSNYDISRLCKFCCEMS